MPRPRRAPRPPARPRRPRPPRRARAPKPSAAPPPGVRRLVLKRPKRKAIHTSPPRPRIWPHKPRRPAPPKRRGGKPPAPRPPARPRRRKPPKKQPKPRPPAPRPPAPRPPARPRRRKPAVPAVPVPAVPALVITLPVPRPLAPNHPPLCPGSNWWPARKYQELLRASPRLHPPRRRHGRSRHRPPPPVRPAAAPWSAVTRCRKTPTPSAITTAARTSGPGSNGSRSTADRCFRCESGVNPNARAVSARDPFC